EVVDAEKDAHTDGPAAVDTRRRRDRLDVVADLGLVRVPPEQVAEEARGPRRVRDVERDVPDVTEAATRYVLDGDVLDLRLGLHEPTVTERVAQHAAAVTVG